jgi:KTSC domain
MPSSVIAAMQYHQAKRALTIVYRGNRGVYRYHDVALSEYADFCAAPSKGTYLNQIFKARQHPFERLHSSQVIHLVDNDNSNNVESAANGKDNRRSNC